MAFYTHDVIADIEDRVRIFYVDLVTRNSWNKSRDNGELRLVTGYAWIEKAGRRRVRGGFKTRSAAMRDAYYAVLQDLEVAPGMRPVPRLVKGRKAA